MSASTMIDRRRSPPAGGWALTAALMVAQCCGAGASGKASGVQSSPLCHGHPQVRQQWGAHVCEGGHGPCSGGLATDTFLPSPAGSTSSDSLKEALSPIALDLLQLADVLKAAPTTGASQQLQSNTGNLPHPKPEPHSHQQQHLPFSW